MSDKKHPRHWEVYKDCVMNERWACHARSTESAECIVPKHNADIDAMQAEIDNLKAQVSAMKVANGALNAKLVKTENQALHAERLADHLKTELHLERGNNVRREAGYTAADAPYAEVILDLSKRVAALEKQLEPKW